MAGSVNRRTLIVGVVVIHAVLLAFILFLLARSRAPSAAMDDEVEPPPPAGAPGTPAGAPTGGRTPATAGGAGIPALTPAANPVRAVPLSQIRFTTGTGVLPAAVSAQTESCQAGILIDWGNRRILWSKSPDAQVPIASMTKMMTVLLLMERIRTDPSITLQTRVKVTKTAAEVAESQVYLDPREEFSLDDLLKCIMVFSANDVGHLVAEFLGGGSTAPFVAQMNKRAGELGLTHTRFVTPHGLPVARQKGVDQSTPRELAYLGALLLNYPEVVKWSSTRVTSIRENDARFKPFQLVNRNGLVGKVEGVNGMKTGYTRAAGWCLTATCVRNGRTLICVVTGCPKSDVRNRLVESLLEWGYTQ